MDPVGTLWSIATLVVTLQEFVDSFEEAPASLLSIRAQIKVVETAVKRVQEWLHFTDPKSRAEVQESLQEAIATVDASMRSLKETLDSILHSGPKATKVLGRQGSDKWTQTKYAWNEKTLNRHLTDMRECALLLAFTLTVCQLPTGRPAEHAIEELGSVARTLSRAHKSTRSGRRVVLTEAKTASSQDQSPDLKALIEGVLAAEDDLSEEEDTCVVTPQQPSMVPPAMRQVLKDVQRNSEAYVGFLDTGTVASRESSRAKNDELFLDSAPQRVPAIPSKISVSTLRKPVPSQSGSSAEGLERSRTEKTPKMLANPMQEANSRTKSTPDMSNSRLPHAVTPPPLRWKAPPHEAKRSISNDVPRNYLEIDRSITQSPEKITLAARESVPSQRTAGTARHGATSANITEEDGTRRVLSSEISEKELYTVDSRSSSPPPYLSPTLSKTDSDVSEQAPIPISAESRQPKDAVVANSPTTCPALIQAVRDNDETLVGSLLGQGADTEAQDQDSACTALIEAARLSRREICRLLLQSGSRLSQKDVEGRTALHLAASRDDTIICRMLLDAGAHVGICDSQSRTPLRLAAQTGSHEAVACLLQEVPVSKATRNDAEIVESFFEAVRLGDIASAQEFLVKHIDLKTIKDTPHLAYCASQSGSIQMLNLVLVQKGILKAAGPDGLTVLHYAAKQGHPAMVEHLLSKGVSWKAQTKQRKETALHLAIAAHQPSAALALIQHKDAKLSTADSDGQEPIHLATRTGDFKTITALLAHGAKLKPTNSYGWKPQHLAAAYGHLALMATFITHGIDLEDKLSSPSFNPSKKTNPAAQQGYWAEIRWPHEEARALHLAIEFGHAEMVKLLLAAGAKADNAPDSQRWQPLHYAAFYCEPEIVGLLLERGVSPHATTQDGNTALGLGFRGVGAVVSEEAKERVRGLLQDASAKRQKSGLAQVMQFRLGSAGMKSVKERNRVYHTAEMAEALYRDRSSGQGDERDAEGESQWSGGEDWRAPGMSSSLTLSGIDRRTSSLSLR